MKPPHWLLAVTEPARTLRDLSSLALFRPLLNKLPRGDGHAVMVIPGFMGDDSYNKPLINFLNSLGYRASGCGLGRNLGPTRFKPEHVQQKLQSIVDEGVEKVSVIGHSLGGIYAREMARAEPSLIRQVITLGSPFAKGRDTATHANGIFRLLNPTTDTDPDLQAWQEDMHEAPPVPTTSIFTRGDGVVNWRTSVQTDGHEQTQDIKVFGSHVGLTLNPAVWFLLADRLQHDEESWSPHRSRFFGRH